MDRPEQEGPGHSVIRGSHPVWPWIAGVLCFIAVAMAGAWGVAMQSEVGRLRDISDNRAQTLVQLQTRLTTVETSNAAVLQMGQQLAVVNAQLGDLREQMNQLHKELREWTRMAAGRPAGETKPAR